MVLDVELVGQPVADGAYAEGLGGVVTAEQAMNTVIASRVIGLLHRFAGDEAIGARVATASSAQYRHAP